VERIVYESTETQIRLPCEGTRLKRQSRQAWIEESLTLNRKLLLSILAVFPAVLMPLAAACQVTPAEESAPNERAEPTFKWAVFAGATYTSLNQVNQSRYGLIGGEATVTRDFGKYFGLTADGAAFVHPVASGDPGSPKVDQVLFGPEFHAEVWGRFSGFFRGLIGGEHTGGESEVPNISFAGGLGGGMEYRLTTRWSARASGEDIYSSFVQDPDHLGYSPHKRGNARASIGVVYRF
jgi:hypothetical protein